MLNRQDFVHALEAETALAIEEIGDVGLFESGLLRQAETGQVTFFDAVPERVTQILLQYSEFHAGSIARLV